jgi:hypothetical protein
MAGSISLSLTQRYDKTSHVAAEWRASIYISGRHHHAAKRLSGHQFNHSVAQSDHLGFGRECPQLFFADGYIKFRLANAVGVTQIDADYTLVMGPTAGVGAAPSVDATTILATGDLKVKYGTGTVTGFVRANGRTLGSATSGATEYANSAAQTLFEYLWTADANLSVSTGRGASANADWTANKTIALPDWRGRALAGLDDMGNSAASRLTATYFGTTATTLGAAGGAESRTLTAAQIPSITSANATQSITVSTAAGKKLPVTSGTVSGLSISGGSGAFPPGSTLNDWAGVSDLTASNSISVTSNNTSGSAHATASPAMLATIYIKL